MLRKLWLKHGDDPFVIKQDKHDMYRPKIPQDHGLLPTPNGCIIVRPGDWICTNDAGVKSVETDPTILNDLRQHLNGDFCVMTEERSGRG